MILTREEILERVPFGPEWLLLDGVEVGINEGTARGKRHLTGNESFFQGHFPGLPVVPGVIIIEAIAQTGACLLNSGRTSEIPVLAGSDFKFSRMAKPGDCLLLEFKLVHRRMGVGKARGKATVDGQLVANGLITFAIVDRTAIRARMMDPGLKLDPAAALHS